MCLCVKCMFRLLPGLMRTFTIWGCVGGRLVLFVPDCVTCSHKSVSTCLRSSSGMQTSGCVWSAVVKCGFPRNGSSQPGLLRNHCDCSWTWATVMERRRRSLLRARASHCFFYFLCRLQWRRDVMNETSLHLNASLFPYSILGFSFYLCKYICAERRKMVVYIAS